MGSCLYQRYRFFRHNFSSMFHVSLINTPSFSLDTVRIEEIFHVVENAVEKPQNGTINIAFLDDSMIQALNKQYRKKDATTDVLSFHYFDDFSHCKSDETVWEIVMSDALIQSQAHKQWHSPTNECEILIIHALLHILGYDHETDEDFRDMWEKEWAIRRRLELSVA